VLIGSTYLELRELHDGIPADGGLLATFD
jgi:hypothetical protein